MARYSPFTGGPAATDVSGLFAQFDSGAIARGVASAGQSIGNALAQRYAQASKDKEDAALFDNSPKDFKNEILEYMGYTEEQAGALSDAQRAKLIPSYQTFQTIAATKSAAKAKDQERFSQEFLNEAYVRLHKPLVGESAQDDLDELEERMNYISRYDLTPEHREQLEKSFNTMYDRVEKGLPLEFKTEGVPDGLLPYKSAGDSWKVINLPVDKVEKGTPFAQAVNEYDEANSKLQEAIKANAPQDKIVQLTREVELFQQKLQKDVKSSGGLNFQFDADGRLQQVTQGGEPTTGSKTKYQYALTKMQQSLNLLEEVESLYKDEFVGVWGAVGETLFDRGFAALDFDWAKDMANEDRIRFRNKTRQFNNTIMRVIGDETRFSNEDREAINESIVNLGYSNSSKEAEIAMDNLRQTLITRAIVYDEKLKQQGEETSLTWLPTSAVIKEFNSGNLTEDNAIRILDEQFKTVDGVDGSFLINTRNYNEVIDALDKKIPIKEQARILKALFPRD